MVTSRKTTYSERSDKINKNIGKISSSDIKAIYTPLIKGKAVSLNVALRKIESICDLSKGIHIDGLGCDMDAMNEIFLFAEKNKASIDHMHADNVSRFYSIFQRIGGNIVSFGEVKKRSDYLLLIGLEKSSFETDFIKELFSKKKINSKHRKIQIFDDLVKKSKYSFNEGIFLLHNLIKSKSKISEHKFESIIQNINESNYGTLIFQSSKFENSVTQEIIELVKTLCQKKKFNFLNFSGRGNLAGAIQTSLWKTGFPLKIEYTKNGPIYNPLEFGSKYFLKLKELQIYISCFEKNPNINFFKYNIFIGHPKTRNKNKFDIFIPTSIPGIDQKGLVLRGDGVCVEKLKKIKDSKLISVKKIFELLKVL